MRTLRLFELEAIRLMAAGVLSEDQLRRIDEDAQVESYNYTGSGYFLTLRDSSLPIDRRTLSEPAVVGVAGGVRAGFVVFLGDRKLTLDCHTWGDVDVPEDFRDRPVAISTTRVPHLDSKRAT